MNFLKQNWRRWNVRRLQRGNLRAMQHLYLLTDPWGLQSSVETVRFTETSRIIRENIGIHFQSILEIGCGEGLQTMHLAPLADRVVGIDPSPLAIQRATNRGLTNVWFSVGDLFGWSTRQDVRYGLVTACEVLYYFNDFELAFRQLNQLGEACVVTYYTDTASRLDSFFKTKPVNVETIAGPAQAWRMIWWRNDGL